MRYDLALYPRPAKFEPFVNAGLRYVAKMKADIALRCPFTPIRSLVLSEALSTTSTWHATASVMQVFFCIDGLSVQSFRLTSVVTRQVASIFRQRCC